jgi:hypothetical protein
VLTISGRPYFANASSSASTAWQLSSVIATLHPAELEISINRGLLTISGEHKRAPAPRDELRT